MSRAPDPPSATGGQPTLPNSVPRARRRANLRRALGALGVLAGLVGLAALVVGIRLYSASRTVRAMLPAHIVSTVINAVRGRPLDDWTPGKQFPARQAMNVLILGCDYDYDDYGRVIKSSARSDSILVAHFDFAHRQIAALTIPRDTAVYIPGYAGYHKINAAHAYGGPQLTEKTIQTEFGIPVDAYVELNFHSFQQIVDALGGIDVQVRKPLNYDDNWGHLHIHLKPGYQHLDGYQAMGYVRIRHSDSDWMRSERQHEFLQAVRTKLANPATFLRLPGLIDTLHDGIQHDVTDDQVLTLANFARTVPNDSVQITTLPSTEGPSYVTVDPAKSAELIQRMFFADQMVALNIDTPDPGDAWSRAVRSGPERTARHGRRRGHRRWRRRERAGDKSDKPGASGPGDGPDTAPDLPGADPGAGPADPGTGTDSP